MTPPLAALEPSGTARSSLRLRAAPARGAATVHAVFYRPGFADSIFDVQQLALDLDTVTVAPLEIRIVDLAVARDFR